jgi:outer membrane protein assembly factor BamB
MEVTGPIAATPDGVLVPVAAGSQFGLACVEPSHDARAVEAREPDSATENSPGSVRWFFETPNAVVLSPAVSAGRALAVDGRPGDAQRHVFGIDMSSGRLVWKWPVDADASGVLTASQDSLFVQDASEALRCLSLDGQERWRRPFGPICQAVDASTAILVAAVESPPGLVAIDRASGAVLWRKALDSTPTTAPAVQKDRLCLGTDAGVEARRLVDGRRVWQLAGEIVTAVYHAPDRCVFVNANGELIIADAATGRVMRRSAAAAPGSVPLVAANGIVVVANGHLQRLGVNGEPAGAPAFGPKDLGTPVSPLVAQDGCVYLGVRGRGMICIGGKPGP